MVPGFFEFGSVIHSRMCSGVLVEPSARVGRLDGSPMPFRFGPIVPVAPGTPDAVWQAMQPFDWNICLPLSGLPPNDLAAVFGGVLGAAPAAGARLQAVTTRVSPNMAITASQSPFRRRFTGALQPALG